MHINITHNELEVAGRPDGSGMGGVVGWDGVIQYSAGVS